MPDTYQAFGLQTGGCDAQDGTKYDRRENLALAFVESPIGVGDEVKFQASDHAELTPPFDIA